MNLFEAKQLLKNNGYQLIKENNNDSAYVCYYLYGDRAHYTPESMEIKTATTEKAEVIDTLASFFNIGPDDISYMVVVKVNPNELDTYKALIDKDISENKKLRDKLLGLEQGTSGIDYIEYNGTDFMDVWEECMGDTDDMSDDEYNEKQDAANAECDKIIRQKLVEDLNNF